MKLRYLFAAALATASLAAQGEELPVHFGSGETLGQNYSDRAPVCFDYNHSGSQTLYTPVELIGLDKGDVVTKVTFQMSISDGAYWIAYGNGWEVPVTVYVQNVSETAFVKSGSKYQWFNIDKTNTGSIIISQENENIDWGEALYEGAEDVSITIELETPLVYGGESLLITWISDDNTLCDDDMASMMGLCMEEYPGFKTQNVQTLLAFDNSANMESLIASNGKYDGANTGLPSIKLTFEPGVHEPTFEAMDAAESIVGQWTSGTASGNEDLPFKTDYEVSGSQTIYTPAFLTDLNTNPDYAYVEISSITVPILLNEGATYSEPFISWIYMGENMDERAADFTVFASTVDETEFIPDKNGDFAYLPYDDGIKGIGHLDAYCDGIENVGYDIIYVTVNFDTPIKYTPGQNLMLTWECMSNIYGESWMEPTYVTNANDGKYHSVYINNMNHSKSGATRYPTLKLGYTPYKEIGSTVEALVIENAEFSLDQVAVAPGLSGFSDLTQINRVNLGFDVTGAAEGTELTVAIGNDVVGTTTDGHVSISFIRPTATEITVAVSADGYKSAMQRISCEPVAALFPAAEVSLEHATYYVEPDANYSSRASLNAAARYHMGTDGYAAVVRSSSNHLIHQSTSLPDELAEFEVGALYNQLHENDHRANCYIKNIQTLDVVDGVAQLKESDPRITADLTVNYPVVVPADNSKSGLLLTTGAKRAVADDMVVNSTAYAKADNIVKPANYGYSGVTHTVPYNDGGLTGIEDVMADAADGGCEVFTLTGVRVSGALTPGVYVMRRGSVVSKVVVR